MFYYLHPLRISRCKYGCAILGVFLMCLCVCVSFCMFVVVPVLLCLFVCLLLCTQDCLCVCKYVCICTYMYVCKCIHTNTHTHTHTQNLTAHPCRPYYQQNATADVKPGSCPECQSKGPLFVNQAYHHLNPTTALAKPYQAEETSRSLSTRHLIDIIPLVKI